MSIDYQGRSILCTGKTKGAPWEAYVRGTYKIAERAREILLRLQEKRISGPPKVTRRKSIEACRSRGTPAGRTQVWKDIGLKDRRWADQT